jgi:YD repeat-containing protein
MADYNWNMGGIPIEEIHKVDGQVIAASATDYNINTVYQNGNVVDEFIAPKDIYRYETTVPGAGFNESSDGKSFSSYSKKATIHKHDDDGNVLEVSKENDTRISYIWGYGGKYPVAKIENVTYSSIPIANINDIKAKSNLDDDNCHDASSCDEKNLRLSLNALRSVLPGALITTFTYDPGIGLTSQTDANNRTTYFEYDSFGRLKFIRDSNNNILKSYDYHYIEQPGN